MTEVPSLSYPKPRETAMRSSNMSENGRHDWIDTPDTKGRAAALHVMLVAICLVAAGFMALSSVLEDAERITRLAGL